MSTALTASELKGLYVALVTPMYHGRFDAQSIKELMHHLEPSVDGFVPCISTGEGGKMDEAIWQDVIRTTSQNTQKPVCAGIVSTEIDVIVARSKMAEEYGCSAVVLPVPKGSSDEVVAYYTNVTAATALPVIIYNTETDPIQDVDTIKKLDELDGVIGIKDSSMNILFFKEMLDLKTKKQLHLSLLQGMEHLLYESHGCDGYMTSILNLEPDLCRQLFDQPSEELQKELIEYFWKYNLGGNWFVAIKAFLCERKIIQSAEEVHLEIEP